MTTKILQNLTKINTEDKIKIFERENYKRPKQILCWTCRSPGVSTGHIKREEMEDTSENSKMLTTT